MQILSPLPFFPRPAGHGLPRADRRIKSETRAGFEQLVQSSSLNPGVSDGDATSHISVTFWSPCDDDGRPGLCPRICGEGAHGRVSPHRDRAPSHRRAKGRSHLEFGEIAGEKLKTQMFFLRRRQCGTSAGWWLRGREKKKGKSKGRNRCRWRSTVACQQRPPGDGVSTARRDESRGVEQTRNGLRLAPRARHRLQNLAEEGHLVQSSSFQTTPCPTEQTEQRDEVVQLLMV